MRQRDIPPSPRLICVDSESTSVPPHGPTVSPCSVAHVRCSRCSTDARPSYCSPELFRQNRHRLDALVYRSISQLIDLKPRDGNKIEIITVNNFPVAFVNRCPIRRVDDNEMFATKHQFGAVHPRPPLSTPVHPCPPPSINERNTSSNPHAKFAKENQIIQSNKFHRNNLFHTGRRELHQTVSPAMSYHVDKPSKTTVSTSPDLIV